MSEPKLYFDRERNRNVLDFRGTQDLPPRPVRVMCDFCGHPTDRLWCYQTAPFDLLIPDAAPDFAYSGGSWNACAACNPFLRRREPLDVYGLVDHVMANNPAVNGYMWRMLFQTYETVFRSIAPRPPVEWLSGDLFPVQFPDGA
jgi:hypothetical protein